MMKALLAIYVTTFLALLADCVAHPAIHPQLKGARRGLEHAELTVSIPDFGKFGPVLGPFTSPSQVDVNTVWPRSVCKGQKLLLGTTLAREDAAAHVRPIDSPWNGNLIHELGTWGFKDRSNEYLEGDSDNESVDGNEVPIDICNFDNYPDLKRAFDDLGVDTRSAWEQEPNRCFYYEHQDSWTVEREPGTSKLPKSVNQYYIVGGKRYRATGAHYIIGVNPLYGIVYFIDRKSPTEAAKELWGNPNPPRNKIPAISSSSDIAWGLWNRMSPGKLRNIHAFLSMTVVIEDTVAIIVRALEQVGILDGVQPWPCYTLVTPSEEYLAILGSPNGIGVGFFLAQHKRQLGIKYIPRVTVFRADGKGSFPNLLFWVTGVTWPPPQPPPENWGRVQRETEHRVLRRSTNGKDVKREHILWARL